MFALMIAILSLLGAVVWLEKIVETAAERDDLVIAFCPIEANDGSALAADDTQNRALLARLVGGGDEDDLDSIGALQRHLLGRVSLFAYLLGRRGRRGRHPGFGEEAIALDIEMLHHFAQGLGSELL